MGMIQSERLDYRKIEDHDFDMIAKIMRDEGVQKVWEHYFTDNDVREWIARRKKGYENSGIDYLLAVNRISQEVVGQVGLLKEEIDGKEVWGIGYILLSQYYGNGYATEGARVMADYAFNILNVPKVVCDIRPMNKPSIAVAKRLGMSETGVFIKHYHGMEMPHLIFELNGNR
jgi:ribosomal-protein-alanine N-acetyltransferase